MPPENQLFRLRLWFSYELLWETRRECVWLVLAEKEGCLDAHSKKDTLVSSEMIRLFGPDTLLLLCYWGSRNSVIVLLLLKWITRPDTAVPPAHFYCLLCVWKVSDFVLHGGTWTLFFKKNESSRKTKGNGNLGFISKQSCLDRWHSIRAGNSVTAW